MSYYFTYGTLMTGKERNYIMQYLAEFVGVFKVKGYKLYDYAANDELEGYQNYPIAIYTGNEDDVILGEVWDSEYEDITVLLDRIEGYPVLYTREQVYIDKLGTNATMYVGNIETWGDCLKAEPFIVEYPAGVMWKYRKEIEEKVDNIINEVEYAIRTAEDDSSNYF